MRVRANEQEYRPAPRRARCLNQRRQARALASRFPVRDHVFEPDVPQESVRVVAGNDLSGEDSDMTEKHIEQISARHARFHEQGQLIQARPPARSARFAIWNQLKAMCPPRALALSSEAHAAMDDASGGEQLAQGGAGIPLRDVGQARHLCGGGSCRDPARRDAAGRAKGGRGGFRRRDEGKQHLPQLVGHRTRARGAPGARDAAIGVPREVETFNRHLSASGHAQLLPFDDWRIGRLPEPTRVD
jgi:hypothetical protein